MATHPPPQHQTRQPGLQHEMEPQPTIRGEYKAAGKLQGKVALITGGDSGIGRSVATLFCMEGASVAITFLSGREDQDAKDTIEMLKKCKMQGSKDPIAIPADIRDFHSCEHVVKKAMDYFGRIDILVNNAAEQHVHEKLEDVSIEEWDSTFKTNIYSMFYLTKLVLPHMSAGSCIINTTSVVAYKGSSGLLPYSVTKSAITGFTRSLSQQLIKRGIRVNAVAPGPIWTPFIPSTMEEESVESFGTKVPMGRMGQPSEMAPSYVFLASEDSSYMAGQVLHPNGGVIVNG